MIQLWRKLSFWGVTEDMPIHQQKGIILFNQIARVLVILLLAATIVTYSLGVKVVSILFIVTIPIIAFSLFLNLKGRIYLSIFIIGFFLPLIFLSFSIITKINGLTNSIFMYLAPRFGIMIATLIPVAVLGFQKFTKMLPPILSGIIMFVFFDYFHSLFGIDWRDMKYESQYYPMIVYALGVYFIIVIAILGFSQGINGYYESIVLKQKEAIDSQNMELMQRQEEIQAQNEEIEQQKQILEKQNQDITQSIQYASRIQRALLPSENAIKQIFPESFVLFQPRDIVSGDFYWAEQVDKYKIIIAADCTGHGVPGGFMSMLEISFINSLIDNIKLTEPQELLELLRLKTIKSLHQSENDYNSSKDGMDVAICIVDTEKNRLHYSGAYNPLWLMRKGQLSEYKATKNPIGLHKIQKDFEKQEIQIEKGDTFYIFSDGFVDQFHSQTGEKYKSRRLKKFITENSSLALELQHKNLLAEFEGWKKNSRQTDDVVLIGFNPLV